MKSYRSWLTIQFHYKNAQITGYALSNGNILLLITCLQSIYICRCLIRQYSTRQLVQVSLFANILPLQNFLTYGTYSYRVSTVILGINPLGVHGTNTDVSNSENTF